MKRLLSRLMSLMSPIGPIRLIALLSLVSLMASAQPKQWTLRECTEYAVSHNLQIKQHYHQQVKQELAEVQTLKHEYLTARDDFRKAITLLHPALKYEIPNGQPRMAAENTEK